MPREEMLYRWKSLVEGETSRGAYGELGEGRMLGTFENIFRHSFESPAEPTVYPRRSSVIVAPAARLTGGKRMTRGKDPDGTEYCRFQVKLGGETESVWMNPDFAEIGYSIEDDDAGWWYVFATVRTAASVDVDPAVSYMGIYQQWYVNDYKAAGGQEIANQAIQGRKGDTAWKTICVGKRRLYKGSRIWVMPGILHPSDWCDVREVRLVDPVLIENGAAAPKDAKAKARAVVVACDKFAKDRNVRIETDNIDNFKYARLAGFDTNAPVHSISEVQPISPVVGARSTARRLDPTRSGPPSRIRTMPPAPNAVRCSATTCVTLPAARRRVGRLSDWAELISDRHAVTSNPARTPITAALHRPAAHCAADPTAGKPSPRYPRTRRQVV